MSFGLLLPVVLLAGLLFRCPRGLGLTARAIQNFFRHGHRSDERDPILWRSPAGRLAHRRGKYYFALFLFSANLLPLGIYIPGIGSGYRFPTVPPCRFIVHSGRLLVRD